MDDLHNFLSISISTWYGNKNDLNTYSPGNNAIALYFGLIIINFGLLIGILCRLIYDCYPRYKSKSKFIFGGYPFYLWLRNNFSEGCTNQLSRDKNRAIFCQVSGKYSLYLYPDGLENWFYLFALIIGSLLAFVHPLFSIFFLSGYWLCFYSIYHWKRLKCLPDLVSILPRRLEEWILGYVERIDLAQEDLATLRDPSKDFMLPADARLRMILNQNQNEKVENLRTSKKNRFIQRLFINHPQEWLLKIAIIRFFEKPSRNIPSISLRILFYWGAPVWCGFILLLLIFLLLIFYSSIPNYTIVYGSTVRTGLIISMFGWAVLSTFFALFQTKLIAPVISSSPLKRNELDAMPIIFQPLFSTHSSLTAHPSYKQFQMMFIRWVAIINFAAFTLFSFLINILKIST